MPRTYTQKGMSTKHILEVFHNYLVRVSLSERIADYWLRRQMMDCDSGKIIKVYIIFLWRSIVVTQRVHNVLRLVYYQSTGQRGTDLLILIVPVGFPIITNSCREEKFMYFPLLFYAYKTSAWSHNSPLVLGKVLLLTIQYLTLTM